MRNKIAIITDLHYGVRSDSQVFLDYYKKFNQVFFKTIKEQNIKHVIIAGDLFDRRKYVNFLTLKRCREDFLQPLNDLNVNVQIIAGNHDVYYKNTNEVNSLHELVGKSYDNIRIHINPKTITINDVPILLLPWLCEENLKESKREISKTKAKICIGHLEIEGFEMYKGLKSFDGISPSMFKKFDLVLSGHFHTRSHKNNIQYIGAAYEQTWSDYGDDRGFSLLDLNTNELTFVKNPYRMFRMLSYDDEKRIDKIEQVVKNGNFNKLKDSYVKILVLKKTNPFLFDQFLDKIYNASPWDVTVIEGSLYQAQEDDDSSNNEEVDQSDDTVTILYKYVDGLQTNLKHDKIKSLLQEIYIQSIELEKSFDNV